MKEMNSFYFLLWTHGACSGSWTKYSFVFFAISASRFYSACRPLNIVEMLRFAKRSKENGSTARSIDMFHAGKCDLMTVQVRAPCLRCRRPPYSIKVWPWALWMVMAYAGRNGYCVRVSRRLRLQFVVVKIFSSKLHAGSTSCMRCHLVLQPFSNLEHEA